MRYQIIEDHQHLDNPSFTGSLILDQAIHRIFELDGEFSGDHSYRAKFTFAGANHVLRLTYKGTALPDIQCNGLEIPPNVGVVFKTINSVRQVLCSLDSSLHRVATMGSDLSTQAGAHVYLISSTANKLMTTYLLVDRGSSLDKVTMQDKVPPHTVGLL